MTAVTPSAARVPPRLSPARQAAIGLTLAALILGGWVALHVWGVFWHRWGAIDAWRAPLLVLLQGWLGAGMFIVAHDAIHGSLAPGWHRLNRAIGRLCVGLYAALSFERLATAHHRHHAAPGTADDPDFHAGDPRAFWSWLRGFILKYFGLRELLAVSAVLLAYLALGASASNLIVFWGLPAVLSAMQLFVFGTWLPHRHGSDAFPDRHRTRSLRWPWLASLLTSFHFGRHHEHHLYPFLPWWRLPAAHAGQARA